ncbi:uncharacterized protein VTP21DRAFT_1675 [Calcarisporiella thermophila]|uniref:uncharacterized protein n=1 Tax=Calcarisporiella thermophila TaxID=911321 RepID=UPI0037423823
MSTSRLLRIRAFHLGHPNFSRLSLRSAYQLHPRYYSQDASQQPNPNPTPTPANDPIPDHSSAESTPISQQDVTKILEFPWLYGTKAPRIPEYPYPGTPPQLGFLNILPQFVHSAIVRMLGMRMLKINTRTGYFPDEFLLGTGMAFRRLCRAITENNTSQMEQMMTSDLYNRFTKEINRLHEANARAVIDIPAIYDAYIRDIWVTLGPPRAFSNPREFNIIEWHTLRLGIRKVHDENESYTAVRNQVAKCLLDGVHFKVDVEVDADVLYRLMLAEKDIIREQSRRTVLVSFETPYFEPADRMVEGRSQSEDNEPAMNWQWSIGDIDQLLERERLEKQNKISLEERASN